MAAAVGSLMIRLHLQAGNLPGVDRRLPLVFVEVGRNGDDGLRHRLAQERLGVLLDRLQHEARELLGRVGLAGQFDRPIAAHVTLEEACAAVGVHDAEFLRPAAHKQLAVEVDAHYRRREILAQGIGDQPRAVGRHVGRHRVGCSQIDADDRAHRRCRSLECTESEYSARPPPLLQTDWQTILLQYTSLA